MKNLYRNELGIKREVVSGEAGEPPPNTFVQEKKEVLNNTS
ncbi:MAG: hypothetical protein ABIG86_00230 [Patescibacteria group bacterium]